MKKLYLMFFILSIFQLYVFAQQDRFWRDKYVQQSETSIENLTTTGSLDSFFTAYMLTNHVPGLAACFIKNNMVAWEGYYGYANLKLNTPFTANTSMEIASISKTIMVTALMQLYEKGLFLLDDSINAFLPFPVKNPNYSGLPITFRMLLTHTSSIRDNWDVLMASYTPGDPTIPLGTFLHDYLVPGGQYYDAQKNFTGTQPGQTYEYCNVGAALAGYLVEAISGVPFNEYCRDSIFVPLQMTNTAWFLRDLDTNFVAHTYLYSSGSYYDYGLYNFPDYPDGSLHTTVRSLAKFLLSYINYGELEGVRLLDSTTISLIHKDGLIWYKQSFGGHNLWGHSGGDLGLITAMFLKENDNTGIIMLTNAEVHPWGTAVERLMDEAYLYGNIYALAPSIDKAFARKNIDSVLFRTNISNLYNHQFTPFLVCENSNSTQIDSLTLLDDGMHGDSLANDGIYSGYILPKSSEDFYSLSVSTIDNQTNKYFHIKDQCRFTTVPLVFENLQYSSISNFRYTFKPFLKNSGTIQSIKNIVVKITCNDAWVTAIPFTERICPNLLPGQNAGITQPFAVSYDSATFPGYFNLRFSVSSYGWSYWEMDTTIIVKPTDVEQEISLPLVYRLEQNFPNPWNPLTTIGYVLQEKSNVKLTVLNVIGEEIAVLVNEEQDKGYHKVEFDGSKLSSGVYFYKLASKDFVSTKKMMLVK